MIVTRTNLTYALACAALVLAGCSGGAANVTPGVSGSDSAQATRHGWILPAAHQMKLVYVTDYNSSVVLIYKQGHTSSGPVGEIATGISNPQGDAVDASGTLYVANQGNSTVTEYPRGATSPSVTLSSGISKPLDVSVDSTGIVYVMDGSASQILEFKPGSTSPDATVNLTHPSDGVNAKNDDLYVSYNMSGGHVARCKPLATTCKDLGITVGLAQGVAIDLMGDLAVGDVYGQVINIYKRRQTTPFRTITTYLEQPSKLALDRTDTTLYMADPANFAIDLFNYATGALESTFTFGSADELEGVGLSPGQRPGP